MLLATCDVIVWNSYTACTPPRCAYCIILVVGGEASQQYKQVECIVWLSYAGGIGRAVWLWEDHFLRKGAAFSARYGPISIRQHCIGPPS